MHRLFRPAIVKSPRRTHGTPSSVCHRQDARSGTFSIPQGGPAPPRLVLTQNLNPYQDYAAPPRHRQDAKSIAFTGVTYAVPLSQDAKFGTFSIPQGGACASAPRLDTKSEPLSRLCGVASSSAGRKIHRFYGHDVCRPAIAGRRIRHILCSSGGLPWREICASAPRRRQKDRNRRSYYDRSQRYQPAAHPV